MRFTGITEDERSALKAARQNMQNAADLMRTTRQAFDDYVAQLRNKYGLALADQVMDQTEQELQDMEQARLDAAQSELSFTSPAAQAKYDAWVAAGRPAPEKQGVFPGR